MRLKSVIVENFGSYECVEFPVDQEGLCLIQGPTGSGKSTLCDMIPWILFGRTAKGGAVDEVLSWPGKKVACGIAIFDDGTSIVRRRGPKPKDNDLYHYLYDEENAVAGPLIRGKDLNDTQKLINQLLGMDYDLYMAGSYYHEFSQTAQFFTTSAKNRRALCEQLTDLSLATKLQPRLIEKYKFHNSEVQKQEINKRYFESQIEAAKRSQQRELTKFDDWEKAKVARLEMLLVKSQEFDKSAARSNKCNSCGQTLPHRHKQNNPYTDRLESVTAETNPHTGGVKDYTTDIQNFNADLVKCLDSLSANQLEIGNIETLQDCVAAYRAKAIEYSIYILQSSTNKILAEFFDAEIKVAFSVEDADKLDVTIHKDGNMCSFPQLSKGQRCLLKLSFGISVMKSVKNYHSLGLNCAFFDEALDGLSEEFKVKAYRLFESLIQDYGSVFVVEHSSELKAMFPNSYKVELINGESFIEKT
jgi:DNA repair exonuclease SbcCD ATPase subunit